MAFLIYTVTLSELRKGKRAEPSVLRWQSLRTEMHFVSVITMNEICFGIHKVRKTDPEFASNLEKWYRRILDASDLISILPVSLPIAEVAADFRYSHRLGYDDSLIAATAKVHGLTVVSRDESGFAAAGVALLNPCKKDS